MLGVPRRLAGLVVVMALAAGLPLAAARAGCVCDHGHQHGTAVEEAHTCTAACTAATCPMHRRAPAQHRDDASTASPDRMGCRCAGDALALIGHASVLAVLPAPAVLSTPPSAPVVPQARPATLASLQPSPPAPPPRA